MNADRLCVFSKHLAGPPLAETARRLRAMGIGAIDLTVRPGGHVEPGQVADALPRAAEELGRHGVRIAQLTTNILDAHAPDTRPILQTAAGLGIRFYKLGYWLYSEFGTLRKLRDEAHAQLRDLAALNLELGVQAGFHNHSANCLGASLWDIDHLLADLPPAAVGLYFDPAHATIEGGSDGWKMGLDLLQERVVMLAVKDYRWVENGGYAGARRFRVQWGPLEDGNVLWGETLRYLQRIDFDGPISLHSEYQGPHSWRDLTADEVFAQTARDADLFRGWLADPASADPATPVTYH